MKSSEIDWNKYGNQYMIKMASKKSVGKSEFLKYILFGQLGANQRGKDNLQFYISQNTPKLTPIVLQI